METNKKMNAEAQGVNASGNIIPLIARILCPLKDEENADALLDEFMSMPEEQSLEILERFLSSEVSFKEAIEMSKNAGNSPTEEDVVYEKFMDILINKKLCSEFFKESSPYLEKVEFTLVNGKVITITRK